MRRGTILLKNKVLRQLREQPVSDHWQITNNKDNVTNSLNLRLFANIVRNTMSFGGSNRPIGIELLDDSIYLEDTLQFYIGIRKIEFFSQISSDLNKCFSFVILLYDKKSSAPR